MEGLLLTGVMSGAQSDSELTVSRMQNVVEASATRSFSDSIDMCQYQSVTDQMIIKWS